MPKKLIVLGSSNVDYILNVPHFLAPGETLAGDQYQVSLGGKGANQAVAAGRAGADVTFIAAVGDDDVGRSAISQFQQDKIDTRLIQVVENEKTGVALIFVNSEGENMIGIYAGANGAMTEAMVKPLLPEISSADLLLMQLETPQEALDLAAEHAKKSGVRVVVNPAPARALSDRFLSFVDIITPNETEAELLTGIKVESDEDAALASQKLHEKGIEIVIITLGKRGAWVSQMSASREIIGDLIPGFRVEAIDTIGAGDTFNGVLVTALLEGKSLLQSVELAHAAGALAVTKKGAHPAIPWRKAIDQFYLENKQ